ncbi:hypothetical protein [Leptolyngbya ohadii]|uniref:hypothetical protein n=1 Tax=Leptolyngbya ohadii TaxID=1962290 RepID=UPI0015C5DA3A|nr:hypothetical protein [Leptolyngbya ohadii]
MTSTVSPAQKSTEIFYPSSDGEPFAETYFPIDAIINTVVILKQHLANQQALRSTSPQGVAVLSNQFLYYAQGFLKLRVAPDVMVIFDVLLGG